MNRNFNTYMAIGNPSTICSSKAKATSTTTKDQGYVMRRSFIIITTLDRTNFCRENKKKKKNIVIVKHFGHIILWSVQSGVVVLLIDPNYVHTNI